VKLEGLRQWLSKPRTAQATSGIDLVLDRQFYPCKKARTDKGNDVALVHVGSIAMKHAGARYCLDSYETSRRTFLLVARIERPEQKPRMRVKGEFHLISQLEKYAKSIVEARLRLNWRLLR
jgi:hypothetical protein